MSNTYESSLAVTGDSLDAYFRNISETPILSAEDERELAVRLRCEDDLNAARQLVMSNLRFVAHIARGYSGYGLAQADLIQEGNIGLMKAVKRFDPEMNVRLISYAVHWIRAEIHEFILRNWRIVKVATTKAQRKLFFNLRSTKKRLGWFTKAEVDTVAHELGVSPAEVMEMETRMSAHDASFDPALDNDDDGFTSSPAAYLSDHAAGPAEDIEQGNLTEHNNQRLKLALEGLDKRSQEILRLRWLDDDNKATLQTLAKRYQVSAERIRQIEKQAMGKLKATLEA